MYMSISKYYSELGADAKDMASPTSQFRLAAALGLEPPAMLLRPGCQGPVPGSRGASSTTSVSGSLSRADTTDVDFVLVAGWVACRYSPMLTSENRLGSSAAGFRGSRFGSRSVAPKACE